MKVVLINPNKRVIPMDYIMRFPPEPLVSLASMLDKRHKVEILDLKTKRFVNLKRKIKNFDLVAVTTFTPAIEEALKICKIAKKLGKKTVLGGVHATLNPILIENPHVDYIIKGEGEETFKELVDGKAPEKILGLSFKKDGKIICNGDRLLIKNIDKLPSHNLNLLDLKKYHAFGMRLYGINTSRGCPHNCSFCCTPKLWKGCWRAKSPERVIEDIKRIPKETRIIYFNDDNFCHDMDRVEKICDLIIKNGLNNFEYGIEARADSIVKNPNIVGKMAKANFRLAVIGIESASQQSLKEIGKGTTTSTMKECVNLLNENGIMVWGTFIIGNLNETKKEILETIKLANKLDIDFAQFTALTPFPGTELHSLMRKKGFLTSNRFSEYTTVYPVTKTNNMPTYKIKLLLGLAYWSFYNPYTLIKRNVSYKGPKRWVGRRFLGTLPRFLPWYTLSFFYFLINTSLPLVKFILHKTFDVFE